MFHEKLVLSTPILNQINRSIEVHVTTFMDLLVKRCSYFNTRLCLFQATNMDIDTERGRESSGLDQRRVELGTCRHQPNTRIIEIQSLKKITHISDS